MASPVVFYFDFASPYAYFSLRGLEAIAERHGRPVAWRPILLWAARKAFDMTPPMEDGGKAAYLPMDMKRSAEFHGLPFVIPDDFGKSTHHAARLFHGAAERDPARAIAFAKAAFHAHFAENRAISEPDVLVEIAAAVGIDGDEAATLIAAPRSRALLAEAIEHAVRDGVWGSPYFVLDGEGFFGADRLPQLDWRLAGRSRKSR